MDRRRARIVAVAMALVLVLALVGGLLASTTGPSSSPSTTDEAQPLTIEPVSDLPTITPAELPPEAIEVLRLVAEGGPFPYEQDGSVFQNREGLLPEQSPGWYREYTVPTPGAGDRGPRRLVVGTGGEVFYTDDHYASFRELATS